MSYETLSPKFIKYKNELRDKIIYDRIDSFASFVECGKERPDHLDEVKIIDGRTIIFRRFLPYGTKTKE